MPEGVAEIEQRAVAGLALVARHDRRPCRGTRWRSHARAPPDRRREHVLPVRLQPGEEAGIAEQAELRDLRIAGAEVARGQRVEQRGIGDHQDRLVERADQVLAMARIDRGLAADRGVDLRQQRGRHLHHVEPAAQDRGARSPQGRRRRRRRARPPRRCARCARRAAGRRRARSMSQLLVASPGGTTIARGADPGRVERGFASRQGDASRRSRRSRSRRARPGLSAAMRVPSSASSPRPITMS